MPTARPRLLDLFCGQGGSTKGFQLAGFHVTGVDIAPQPRYIGDVFHQADALEYLREHGHEYDVIAASPPCQAWSKSTPMEHRADHPQLIGPVRDLLISIGKPYVIENVEGARAELRNPVMLCGTMFELPIWRHRYFETWPLWLMSPATCQHSFAPVLITGTTRRKGVKRVDPPVSLRRDAIACQWMTIPGLDEAIPPAFTKWIGEQLILTLYGDGHLQDGS